MRKTSISWSSARRIRGSVEGSDDLIALKVGYGVNQASGASPRYKEERVAEVVPHFLAVSGCDEVAGRVAERTSRSIVPKAVMKVRFNFKNGDGPKKLVVVDMKTIPRVGESLVSGTWGVCEVMKVLHTPESLVRSGATSATKVARVVSAGRRKQLSISQGWRWLRCALRRDPYQGLASWADKSRMSRQLPRRPQPRSVHRVDQ